MTGRKQLIVLCIAGALSVCTGSFCFSGEGEADGQLAGEIRRLKMTVDAQARKIQELEERLSAQESRTGAVPAQVPPETAEAIDRHLAAKIPAYALLEGLDVSGWVTTVVQSARNANGDALLSRTEDATDASYSADILLEKKFEDYGWGLVHFQAGNGAGVTDELTLYSNVNFDACDADNNVSIIEAWYEHYFKAVPLTVAFGKLDPYSYIDANEYANDETSQFLGDMFSNSPVIEWPSDNGEAGLRIAFEPSQYAAFDFLATDSDADGEDAYDALFLAGQATIKPNLLGKQGTYRLTLWRNNANHTRWNDSTRDKESGWGWGLSFDQEFTDCLGGFFRYGWQDPDVYVNGETVSLVQAYSFGPQFKGSLWHRPEDVVGIGFGQVYASKKCKDANGLIARPETHLEGYYNFKANRYFTVSPDLQIIWRPYGKDAVNGDGTILVTGVRAELDF